MSISKYPISKSIKDTPSLKSQTLFYSALPLVVAKIVMNCCQYFAEMLEYNTDQLTSFTAIVRMK